MRVGAVLDSHLLIAHEDILCSLRQQRVAQRRIFIRIEERRQIVSLEEIAQNGKLFAVYMGGLFDIIFGGRNRVASAVNLHGFAHVFTNADIVDDHAVFLAGILAIDTADGLNEQMLLERLVVVHVGQRRHIETRNPHVDHNDNPEVGLLLLESGIQLIGALVVSDTAEIIIHVRLVVAADAGHHGHGRHGLQLAQLFLGDCHAIRSLLLFKPLRIQCLELLKQRERNHTA